MRACVRACVRACGCVCVCVVVVVAAAVVLFCFVLFFKTVCIFVTHVWHPRFPLSGIKKHLTLHWYSGRKPQIVLTVLRFL